MELSQAMGVELGAGKTVETWAAVGEMVYLEAARCGSAAHYNTERHHAHFQRSGLGHGCRSEADGALPLQRQMHAGCQRG